ncbi:mitochondrial fission ELM1 family protein [Faunimonas sp. B44]|uniref:mitochondrial fission ELM1 family protein n=1 Tax=Faunimonas sp. B44 TaxID=3461493 RepID=UPI0040441ACA
MGHPGTIWLITDGKAGDLAQAEGLAAALGGKWERRDVAARRPWSWLAPWGPPDPLDDPKRPGGRYAPPLPDLVIATGRRTVPTVRSLRRREGARPFTVFLKNPRVSPRIADLVWAPEHDGLAGENVVTTLTAPHRFSPARLAALRQAPSAFAALPRPILGIVLGGDAGGTRYAPAEIAGFAEALAAALPAFGSILATPSRRTPPALAEAVRNVAAGKPGLVWDGTGENPLPAILAFADALVVTGDSHNMVSEALASGAPVHVLRPKVLNRRIARFLDLATARELIRPFPGIISRERRRPLDATAELAARVLTAYSSFTSTEQRKRS